MTSNLLTSWTRWTLAAAALLVLLAGCGGPTPQESDPQQTSCQTSEDCDGGICLLNICRDCIEDSACEGDYGQGATCVDGACQPCQGALGCACGPDDQCDDGLTCDGDTCQDACTAGTEGCPCEAGGICADGLSCQDDVCAPEVCVDGQDGCPCNEDGTCEEGLLCGEDNVCAPEACQPGQDGCECRPEGDDPACDEGLTCMENLCVSEDCQPGQDGCPCDEEDACEEGFACTEDGMCTECTPEYEGCPCDEEGECENDLVCDEDEETCREAQTCEDLGCGTNQLCQDEEAGIDALCLEECAEGFVFNFETGQCDEALVPPNCQADAEGSILGECGLQNRTCVEDGDSAACGACLPNFLEEAGQCRAVVTCADLDCDVQNRDCTPQTELTDAVCAGCSVGFEENDGVCERIPQVNCQPGAELSILTECSDQNRLCVEDENGAACGDCLADHAEDPETQECVRRLCEDLNCGDLGRECAGDPLAECGECQEGLLPSDPNNPLSQCRDPRGCLDLDCPEGKLCVERDGQDAVCADWPCVDINGDEIFEQAFRADTNTCVECGLRCEGEGLTGAIWPYTLVNSNRCICATEDGYYFDVSGAFTALACDADDDGWIRSSARDIIESGDPTLEDNARCDLRTIDRFTLENEYQQRMDVMICDEGYVDATACQDNDDCGELGRCNLNGTCECVIPSSLDLYESVRNDEQTELDEANILDVPVYSDEQDRGRQLKAGELNPLTRACITAGGDYNNNGVSDISEWQGLEPGGVDADTIRFMNFAYFVELHDGFFEDINNAEEDRYVIREKSRCDASFPVQYDAQLDADNWQNCTRNRDADYDATGENALINYDFAAFNCEQDAETCPLVPPLVDITPDGEVPLHGLCDEGITLPPADGVWRGMNHHSQFKCIQVVDTAPEDRDALFPHQRTLDELTNSLGDGNLQLTRCGVACPDGDASCAEDCVDGQCNTSTINNLTNPNLPIIECTATMRDGVDEDEVGFAAVRYIDSPGLYERGCIDEFTPSVSEAEREPWRNLCPGYAINPAGVVGDGNPGNFGLLICGCGFNYGGPNCDQGCSSDMLHYGGENEGDTCDGGYCPVSADENGGGRRGFWMCGATSTVSYEGVDDAQQPALRGDVWSLEGEINQMGIEKHQLCQDEACNSGWTLR